jgi:hypothetical protein
MSDKLPRYKCRKVQLFDSLVMKGDDKVSFFGRSDHLPLIEGQPWVGVARGDEMLILHRLLIQTEVDLDTVHVAVRIGLRTIGLGFAADLEPMELLLPGRQDFAVTLAPLSDYPVHGEVKVFVDATLLQECRRGD